MADWYWYDLRKDGTARVLRVFGASPEVEILECIAGRNVTEIGDYCFAEKSKYTACHIYCEGIEEAGAEETFWKILRQGKIRELSGTYLRKVVLPGSIVSIGNFCFYQCSFLEQLVVGNSLTGIGSDAFMNCRSLQKITINGSITEPSGLKQILAQRAMETEVSFITGDGTDAMLLYPEYSETYDEIGPAHIFELNIEGEGFRARQCFSEGIVDLAKYDGIFLQARAEESVKTLCRMAWFRLYYPAGLREEPKAVYEEYIKENAAKAGEYLVEEKNLELLCFAGEQRYFGEREIAGCIRYAAEQSWTEGAGMLLQYQSRWFAGEKQDEYAFDAFL
jgi:hypothetical protein